MSAVPYWEGIASGCQPANRVALGLVEGLNDTIRVSQRRAYALRDEENLRLEIPTACSRPSSHAPRYS